MMLNQLLVIVAIATTFFFCPSAVVGQDVVDKNSGFPLPETLGDYKRDKIIDNELQHRGLGTTVYYNASGSKATLYVYTLGEERIPDGIENDVIKRVFEKAMGEIKKASEMGYFKLTSSIVSEKTFLIPSRKVKPVLMAKFSYIDGDKEYASYLYVYGKKNRIIKIRISNPAKDEAQATLLRQVFLKAVSELI